VTPGQFAGVGAGGVSVVTIDQVVPFQCSKSVLNGPAAAALGTVVVV